MKKKTKIPKSNKFIIEFDPLARQSHVVNEMIRTRKGGTKVIPNKKKEVEKDICRKKPNVED